MRRKWFTVVMVALAVIALAILIMGVGIVIELCEGSFLPGKDTDVPLAWTGYEGIYVTENGGATVVSVPVHDKKGRLIKYPEFALWQDALVYWPPEDKALCLIRRDGGREWVNLANYLPRNVTRVELEPGTDGIWCNLYSRRVQCNRIGTIYVMLRHAKPRSVKQLGGAIEVRSDGNRRYAVLDAEGWITIHSSGRQRRVDANYALLDWDVDFDRGIVFCLTPYGIVTPERDTSFEEHSRLLFPDRLWCVAKKEQVWLLCAKPMSSGFIILVYDYDGNIRGKRLNTVAQVVGNVVELQDGQARWLLALKQ